MTITHYEADDLPILVNVTFEEGAEITSLVGGSVEALAQAAGGAVIPASSVSIIDPDTVRVAFNDGVLAAGVYTLQVRATVSGVTQTIAEEVIDVRASL
ncbi:hypothetical protein [Microcystis phage Mae-JY02]